MFKLLEAKDKSFLDNSNFAKNAVFYKDMLCFYEAYSLIRTHENNLPNFCYFKKNQLCLEGICLLIKMYATEFKFETLKLTLDYLKILYYTIASYAEDDEVDKELIIKELDEYRLASFDYCKNQSEEFDKKYKAVADQEKDLKSKLKKAQSLQRRGKVNSVLTVVTLILSILMISAPILVMNYLPGNQLLFIASIVVVVVLLISAIILKISSKKAQNTASDLMFHIQNLKKTHETEVLELANLQSKYYKVFCEKYEYKTYFPEIFSKYTKVLSIEEILAKAKNYKMISYNLAYDISRLFKSQQKEISDTIADIENIVFMGDHNGQFASVYSKICEQDWLYYNAEVRLSFLKKFTDIADRAYDWKLEINGKRINPFDVNVREISREMIAFSSESGKKMVSVPFSEFAKTKYFKGLEQLNFKNGYNIEEFKKIKANYLKHFYRFDVMSKLTNVFYDKKDNQKIRNLDFPIDEMERVPTLVSLKLKLIENLVGMGNSDAGVIKSLAQSLFDEIEPDGVGSLHLSEEDIEYPKFTAERTEEFEDYVVYYVNGEKKIGYKI